MNILILSIYEHIHIVNIWIYSYCQYMNILILSIYEYIYIANIWIYSYCKYMNIFILSIYAYINIVNIWIYYYCQYINSRLHFSLPASWRRMEGEVLYFHAFLTPVPDASETRRFTPWRRPGQTGERKNLLHPAEVEPPNFLARGLLTTVIVTSL